MYPEHPPRPLNSLSISELPMSKVDAVGVSEKVRRFCSRSIKGDSKLQGLKLALSMIDLTTLQGNDTPEKVRQLCHKAKFLHAGLSDIPSVAAVCVYPNMVATAKAALSGSHIKVASVATAFPGGMLPANEKLADVRFAVSEGADEIDMVISRGKFLAGEFSYVFDEIAATKEACGSAHLKVILETGELGCLDAVRLASDIAMRAGAHFIKTSTGKIQPAATMSSVLVMLEAIRDYYYETGRQVGMKPAGGISTAKSALHYLVMLRETLGSDWLSPELFRFGASSLANDILMQLEKQRSGRYQSRDYFSVS